MSMSDVNQNNTEPRDRNERIATHITGLLVTLVILLLNGLVHQELSRTAQETTKQSVVNPEATTLFTGFIDFSLGLIQILAFSAFMIGLLIVCLEILAAIAAGVKTRITTHTGNPQ